MAIYWNITIIIIIITTRVPFALLQVIMSWCHQTPGPHTELKTLKLVRLVWIPCLFLSRMTLVLLAHCKIAGRWVLVTDRHTPCQSYLVIIGFIQGTVFAALLTIKWHVTLINQWGCTGMYATSRANEPQIGDS
jgi:hypothetical protein